MTNALQLTPRGFVANDGLVLIRLSGHLHVEWLARIVHPWELCSQRKREAELFRDQTIRDTGESIVKFFERLPDINAIDVRVREPSPPNRILLIGRVDREDALATRSLVSPDMRFRIMGLRWVMNEAGEEFPMEVATSSRQSAGLPRSDTIAYAGRGSGVR